MTDSTSTGTYTPFLLMTNIKLAAQCSGGRHSRPAVGPFAGALPPVVMAGKQILLVRRHPPGPGRHLPSLGWTSRAAGVVVASATATATAATSSRQSKEEDRRASRNVSGFQPSIWGDFFLTYSSPLATSSAQKAWMVHRAEQLKEQVAKLIAASSACSLYHRIHLIDVLKRLCLDHLFEDEINDMLTRISNVNVCGCDLQTVAMWFYLLRKHGYRVSSGYLSDVLREAPSRVVPRKASSRGLGRPWGRSPCCLPWISGVMPPTSNIQKRTHGEIILDEAISFTTKCLKSVAPNMETSLASEIKRVLEIPLPRSQSSTIILCSSNIKKS
ncbi:alpha-terpineol synthase, chloroplastic-like isoform X3 [Miscanthus floridulus]|uniref:alpha-terpineol synthase, chloroplastic-like isoform X3 n=1 Tax=Miscanthus floridulus TaxID=154761 RepID=UPI00345827EB